MVGEELREPGSVVERFAHAVAHIAEPEQIERASLGEAARIVTGPEVGGVRLKFLDLSSLSPSGSFKDWAACLTMAYCLQHGISRFVTQSSGSTANSLALYAARAGVEMVALYPRLSRRKINPAFASAPGVTLIEADHPEPQLKVWADELGKWLDCPWLPTLELQKQGNKLRAYLLNSWAVDGLGLEEWHAQALSSAFGPIGAYIGFRELAAAGSLRRPPPRFLGVQQEAVHPFATHLNGTPPAPAGTEIIEPTLFRTQPTPDLLDAIEAICRETQGAVVVASNRTVAARLEESLHLLHASGLRPVRVGLGGQEDLLELAGPICLTGVLEEIESGSIRKGSTVVVVLTGGFGKRGPEIYEPEFQIASGEGLDGVRGLLGVS